GRKLGALLTSPPVNVRNAELEEDAARLGRLVGQFGAQVERALRTYQREIVDQQLPLGRIADAGTELYVSACVLNRLDALLRDHHASDADKRLEPETGRYYPRRAGRRIQRRLTDLWDNDDDATTRLAQRMIRQV